MTDIISPRFYIINKNKYQVETGHLYKYTYKFVDGAWLKHGLQFVYEEIGDYKYLRFQFDTINDNLKGMFYEFDIYGRVIYSHKF